MSCDNVDNLNRIGIYKGICPWYRINCPGGLEPGVCELATTVQALDSSQLQEIVFSPVFEEQNQEKEN